MGKQSASAEASKREKGSRAESDIAEGAEQKLLEFAEQLGWLMGTVQARSEGWLDRRALAGQIGRIRDRAAELMTHIGADDSASATDSSSAAASKPRAGKGAARSKNGSGAASPRSGSVAAKKAQKAMSAGRGPVDGPGKRHRPAPPSARGVKHSDQRVAKEMITRGMKRRPRG